MKDAEIIVDLLHAPKRVTLFHSFCNFLGYCWSSVQICIGRFLYLCRPAKVIGIPQGRRSHLHGSIPMLLISCIFAVCQRFCQGVESQWPGEISITSWNTNCKKPRGKAVFSGFCFEMWYLTLFNFFVCSKQNFSLTVVGDLWPEGNLWMYLFPKFSGNTT